MKLKELRQIIREELESALSDMSEEAPLTEKSVPEPYDRKGARKMSGRQIEKRDRIGKAMKSDEKTTDRFRKKHGQDWESWLWRSATASAMRAK